ncbi:hypothetical protein [Leptolyngbya ohadii]|uniref:hypothetical protein n=1 Tax=Leptolyngbya ohadii TaxID=1962290 RepID=UPI00117B7C65|nr:hypothetical protein [Leptolyngbya ohadii]
MNGDMLKWEHCDRRIIGAIRFVDAATDLQIRELLQVEAPKAKFIRNLSGYYVIVQAPGFETYSRSFETAPIVAPQDLTITIQDNLGQYLTQQQTIRIPPNDPFQPLEVRLFPAPTAKLAAGWAVVRVIVTKTGTDRGLAGAYVRVLRASDSRILGTGLSDQRGEAVVAVVRDIPAITWKEVDGRLVMTSEIAVRVEAFFDAAASPIPNPVQLENRLSSLPTTSLDLMIAASRSHVARLAIDFP